MPSTRYDTTNLAVLAAFTCSMNEFLDVIGAPRTQRVRRNMWQRLRTRGIDTVTGSARPR